MAKGERGGPNTQSATVFSWWLPEDRLGRRRRFWASILAWRRVCRWTTIVQPANIFKITILYELNHGR
jgi:hypothetical protein